MPVYSCGRYVALPPKHWDFRAKVILVNHRRLQPELSQIFYVYLQDSSLNKVFFQKHYLPDVDIRQPVKMAPKVLPSKLFL
jgi:hypothetical protein